MAETVLVIGCGNMGFAMLKGWVERGAIEARHVTVVEPSDTLRERATDLGVDGYSDVAGLKDRAFSLAVIAVKPQMLATVLPDYKPFAEAGTAFLTVAAGAPIAFYEGILGETTGIIRSIPNTPAAVGKGLTATRANAHVTPAMDAFAHSLLAANGVVEKLDDEALIDAVTAISGSGPAYVFHFIEALTEAARAVGLPDAQASSIARQTVIGAAALAEASDESAAQLRINVTSPKGTTAAALDVLMGDEALTRLTVDAAKAAKARAIELGKS